MGGLIAVVLLLFCLWWWFRRLRNRKKNTTNVPDVNDSAHWQVRPYPLPGFASVAAASAAQVVHEATDHGSNHLLLDRPIVNPATVPPPIRRPFEKGQHDQLAPSSDQPASIVTSTASLPAATSITDIQEIRNVRVVAHEGGGPEIDAPPSYASAWSDT